MSRAPRVTRGSAIVPWCDAAARVAWVALLALLAALAADPARAIDDAGTRSVLSSGAGARALALGGAFSALADDASASLWNPAGLGRVEQGELQFAQAQYALDFQETFAAAVFPDWRWGALALTVRHFGTAGIENRDARNTLIADDLTGSDSEVGLAYGRAFGPAWSVGAATKLRRQELAGRSGTGVGADLGLHFRPGMVLGVESGWSRGIQLGLALRNLIEPAMRLDQESVADPSSARFGLAFEPPLRGPFDMTVSLDVEKARGIGPRTHAGVELRPHALLALRAGFDHGTLTAGTGFQIRDAEIAYAFEDQPLGAAHRAGLTLRFGASVPEAREAAARAEEERFASRLAETERQRDAQRIDALLARAEDARRRQDFDQASSLTATARVLDPDHAGARALEVAVLTDRGRALEAAGDPNEAAVSYQQALALAPGDTTLANALARSRAESDERARRSDDLRRRFAAALSAFGADRLGTARDGFAAIVSAQPGDTEARIMLERVQRSIATRTQDLVRRASLLSLAGELDEAVRLLAQARELDPQAAGLAAATATLEERRLEATRLAPEKRAPVTPPAPRTPYEERDLANFYRRGVEAFQAGRSDEALRFWELVWSIRPGYQRVDEYLKREYLTRGMEHFAAGRLLEAVSQWERALQVDPKDARALAYLARAHEQIERARAIGGGRR